MHCKVDIYAQIRWHVIFAFAEAAIVEIKNLLLFLGRGLRHKATAASFIKVQFINLNAM